MAKEGLFVFNESITFGTFDLLAIGGEAKVGAMDLLGHDPLAVGELLSFDLSNDLLLVGVFDGGIVGPFFTCKMEEVRFLKYRFNNELLSTGLSLPSKNSPSIVGWIGSAAVGAGGPAQKGSALKRLVTEKNLRTR